MVQAVEGPGLTLLNSLQDGLVAGAEIAGNRLLSFDDNALQRCVELEGCCIAIEVTIIPSKTNSPIFCLLMMFK